MWKYGEIHGNTVGWGILRAHLEDQWMEMGVGGLPPKRLKLFPIFKHVSGIDSDENMSPTIATFEVRNETPSNVSIPSSTIVTGTLANVTNLSAVELKRKPDREVYASLSAEEKEAKLQNNRDYRQRKKEAKTSLTGTLDDITNLSAIELGRKRDKEMYASLPAEKKEAKLQKNRDYRQRKKEATISPTGTLGDITNLTPIELTWKQSLVSTTNTTITVALWPDSGMYGPLPTTYTPLAVRVPLSFLPPFAHDCSCSSAAETIGGIRWWVELREAERGSKPATLEVSAVAGWKDVAAITRENERAAAIHSGARLFGKLFLSSCALGGVAVLQQSQRRKEAFIEVGSAKVEAMSGSARRGYRVFIEATLYIRPTTTRAIPASRLRAFIDSRVVTDLDRAQNKKTKE
uniref:Uncharacterized protein n=1 Tax=Oryza rufipogon TaxID=4529 RepID=A0A0E0RB77_ORYRU